MSNQPQHSIKAVLFDLDGTLLDTAPDLINALDHVLKKHNFDVCDRVLARAQVSHGATALLRLGFGSDYERFDPWMLRQDLLNYYYDNLAHDTKLFAAYEDVLNAYSENNIAWGIVTNKPAFLTYPLMQIMYEKQEILKQSQCLIAADSYVTRKPFGNGLLQGAAELKVAPKHTAYIGDSIRDIEAGRHASMFTVAVEFGYIGDDVNINDWQADKIISNPHELLELHK